MTLGQVLVWSEMFVWYLMMTSPWVSAKPEEEAPQETFDEMETSTAKRLLSTGVAGDVWHMRRANDEDRELIGQLEQWEHERGG
jgi:hypothetical protein